MFFADSSAVSTDMDSVCTYNKVLLGASGEFLDHLGPPLNLKFDGLYELLLYYLSSTISLAHRICAISRIKTFCLVPGILFESNRRPYYQAKAAVIQ